VRAGSGTWKWVVAWAIIILIATSVPVVELARRGPPPWLDETVHFTLYAVLGWLVGVALSASGRRGYWTFVLALASIAAFGALDELHQRWLPGRVPTASDWAFDLAGATIGLVAGMIIFGSAIAGGSDRPESTGS
jgi:VanZ family protein